MTLVLLTAVGALLAVDGVTFAQTMVSRPLVTGVIVGAVLGDVVTGAQVGALLELYLLVEVPTGGGRFPEGSVATTVATAAAVTVPGLPGFGAAIALGLVWGWLGGVAQSGLRRLNDRGSALDPEAPVSRGRVTRAVLSGFLLDLARAGALCAVGGAIALHLFPLLVPGRPPGSGGATLVLGVVLLGAGMVSAGVLLRNAAHRRADWLTAAVAAAIGWAVAGGVG